MSTSHRSSGPVASRLPPSRSTRQHGYSSLRSPRSLRQAASDSLERLFDENLQLGHSFSHRQVRNSLTSIRKIPFGQEGSSRPARRRGLQRTSWTKTAVLLPFAIRKDRRHLERPRQELVRRLERYSTTVKEEGTQVIAEIAEVEEKKAFKHQERWRIHGTGTRT